MNSTQNQYVPGSCNIGKAEIAKRKIGGWSGLIATVFLYVILMYSGAAPMLHLFLFFPAMMAATGFLQAYNHFCVYFGFASLFNFGDDNTRDTVEQAEYRAKDRQKAWQIVWIAFFIAVAVTLIGVLI